MAIGRPRAMRPGAALLFAAGVPLGARAARAVQRRARSSRPCPPSRAGRARSAGCGAHSPSVRATRRTAIAAAQAYLELARAQGDARYAGHAMGALQAWEPTAAAQTPPAVLVMRATVAQFLHDFDGGRSHLEGGAGPQPDQRAGLDHARHHPARARPLCRIGCGLPRAGPRSARRSTRLACLAENAGLRGDHAAARDTLRGLLADPALQGARQAGTRQWLLTSLAEVEELAGRPAAAEAAYRQALAGRALGLPAAGLQRLPAAQQRRRRGAAALLGKEPRSDAVLLRLAIAARRAGAWRIARRHAGELQARFDAAALRPGTTAVHAREGALFALDVQGDARRALELARANVRLQREPIDLLLLARAAVAANDEEARSEVKALMHQHGAARCANRRRALTRRPASRRWRMRLGACVAGAAVRPAGGRTAHGARAQGQRRLPAAAGRTAMRSTCAGTSRCATSMRCSTSTATATARLSWGEVHARMDDIRAYALARLRLQQGRCALTAGAPPAVDDRIDGAYLVLPVRRRAAMSATALSIDYRLFREVDPTHRGLLRIAAQAGAIRWCVRWTHPAGRSRCVGHRRRRRGRAIPAQLRAQREPLSRRRPPHPDRLRPHPVPDLPAAARRAAPRAGGWEPVVTWRDAVVADARHRHDVHPRALDHAGAGGAASREHFAAHRSSRPSRSPSWWRRSTTSTRVLRGRRELFSFLFGLIHGFGFAGALAELDLPLGDFVAGAAAVQPGRGSRAARRSCSWRSACVAGPAPLASLPGPVLLQGRLDRRGHAGARSGLSSGCSTSRCCRFA